VQAESDAHKEATERFRRRDEDAAFLEVRVGGESRSVRRSGEALNVRCFHDRIVKRFGPEVFVLFL
jgi:hypothetical protein